MHDGATAPPCVTSQPGFPALIMRDKDRATGRVPALYFRSSQAHHSGMGNIDWIPLDGQGPFPPQDGTAFLAANDGDWAKVVWTPQGLWTGEVDEEGAQVMCDDATHWAAVGLPF